MRSNSICSNIEKHKKKTCSTLRGEIKHFLIRHDAVRLFVHLFLPYPFSTFCSLRHTLTHSLTHSTFSPFPLSILPPFLPSLSFSHTQPHCQLSLSRPYLYLSLHPTLTYQHLKATSATTRQYELVPWNLTTTLKEAFIRPSLRVCVYVCVCNIQQTQATQTQNTDPPSSVPFFSSFGSQYTKY